MHKVISEDYLFNIFVRFGTIERVTMKSGFAFIRYMDPYSAWKARSKMHHWNVHGLSERLVVEYEKTEKTVKKDYKCKKCNKLGHWEKHCPDKK